jgi:hypothetical protein
MKEITTVGVDLAKSVFTIHGVDAAGRAVLRKTVRREKLLERIAMPALENQANRPRTDSAQAPPASGLVERVVRHHLLSNTLCDAALLR